MAMKILVTGAGGYIGRHVCKCLLDMGVSVIACDHILDGLDERAERISTDIFSGSETIFDEVGRPDRCLHMAWKDGFIHNSDAHMLLLSRHFEFLRNMTKGGAKHLAVMGTMHEVGYWEGAIKEDTPCNPSSQYGIAKNALRASLMSIFKDTDVHVQWLRAYYIYGDDFRNHSIFTKLLQAERDGAENFPFVAGKNKYDFIHVDELAKMIAFTVLQTEVTGIINCCTGIPMSIAEKTVEFIKENKMKIKLDYGAFPDRPYDSPAIWGDTEKISKILLNAQKQAGERY
jgi:Nucleoside-diphosphate-sugar epimerases